MLPKRRLGRTELLVSNLGFGSLGILDRYLSRWSADTGPLKATSLFEFILDQGINLVDTARWYEESEERLGAIIASRRAECVITSKTLKRDSVGTLADISESVRQLQTDYIDVYLIHHIQWPEELHKIFDKNGALEGLWEARANGKIGFIGISGHDPDLLCAAISTGAFDVVELPYNALDHEIFQPVVERALELDVGVLTMKALAAGKFVDSKGKVEKALQFALCVSGVASVIVGLSTIDQVLFDVEVARQVDQLSTAERENALAEIMALPRDYWGVDSQYYDPAACPFNVPIGEIMRLERYRTIYKNGHRTKFEYSQLPIKADPCAACPGYCELPSPFGLSTQGLLIRAHERLGEPITDREIFQHGGEIVK
jgi:predicted aldo/keto reductase-like oxidoreductase